MVRISEQKQDFLTADAIDKYHEDNQESDYREYLGASMLGAGCKRAVYYSFRWFGMKRFPGRILRLFDRGREAEEKLTLHMRNIGIKVEDLDPKTGQQFAYKRFNGHIGGHADGFVTGLLEDPADRYVIDYKTANDSNFKQVLKHGLKQTFYKYYVQITMYMKWSGVHKGVFLFLNKNNDELYQERITYSDQDATALENGGKYLVTTTEIPPKISKYPDHYVCKMCDHYETCHFEQKPPKNCRTCIWSRPITLEGVTPNWECSKYSKQLSKEQQLQGCNSWEEIK